MFNILLQKPQQAPGANISSLVKFESLKFKVLLTLKGDLYQCQSVRFKRENIEINVCKLSFKHFESDDELEGPECQKESKEWFY